ncbi:MAG: type II secretion system secretin GspD [Alphaproteobacteria bacterium]
MRYILKTGIALAALILTPVGAAFAQGDHLITMQEADIRAFIDDVSMVTGKTFLVDPRVQGKVTISSEQSLSSGEVFEVFKDVMRVHGYTLVRTATGEYRITLLQGAAQDAPFVKNSGYNGQFATTVIKLSYADAAEAAKLIKPVLHSQGILTANPGGDVIVITDFPENLRKAREVIAAMDTDGRVIETVRLTNITALDAEDAMKALGGTRPSFKAIAVPGSNSLILEGKSAELARLKQVLRQMDEGGATPRGAVSVVPLRFADGEPVIDLLQKLLPTYAREGQPIPAVAYESGSNTIVISAGGETQQALEQIIRRLDVRRPQVLVEAIIVEVSDKAVKELGVQFALGGADGSSVPFIGTNFSRQASNALALTGALAGGSLGLDSATQTSLETAAINSVLGLEGGTFGVGGQSGSTLFSAILTAIETDENSNVLSTPFITTLDNVPATFLGGQEIPITTGSSVGTDLANPFQTFERIDVGVKLEVLPQISEGDVIRLEIKQEVSSIAGALSSISSDFVTNKREISTTVLANNGEIIVLGGLIKDDEQFNEEKVPVLGDVPVIGGLFRAKGKSRTRNNLMVFLRPTIIRNSEDAKPLTQRRLDYIRAQDMQQSGRTISKLDEIIDNP